MTFTAAQPAGGMKGKSLSLSLTEEGQKSGDLPTNKGKALKGSKVITPPSPSPSSKAHWRIHPDYTHAHTEEEVQLRLPGRCGV